MKNSFFNLIVFALLFVFLSCEDEYVKPVKITYHQQSIDSSLTKDADLESFIKPYKEKIDAEMNTVLSYAPKSMFKTDSPYNTAIGNMMADAILQEASPIFKEKHDIVVDAVLLNYGGIRSGISEGDISVRTAFDIMPFENEVIVVELPYEAVQDLIKYLISKRTAHPIAGINIALNHDYSLKKALVNNEEIKLNTTKDRSFYIATTDYLLQGGDEMFFFEKNTNVFQSNYKLRNLLIDYFEKEDEIVAQQDNRFTVGN